MKRSIITLIVFLYTIVFVTNCSTVKKTTSDETSHAEENFLAQYGEVIYKRESCNNCHTQRIGEESQQLISLDGVGGKYPSTWLYYYLEDPRSLIWESTKPSYSKLHNTPLDKNVLSKIRDDRKLEIEVDVLWGKVLSEAEILSKELEREGISTNNTEVLALISFIQQIPSSKKLLELDSLFHIQLLEERRIWDDALSSNNSIVLKAANNEENIEKGRLLFRAHCFPCHGHQGEGIIGPNLTDDYWLHGSKKIDIARTIIHGVPQKGMKSWKDELKPTEIGELVSYIFSLRGTNPENAKAPQGKIE